MLKVASYTLGKVMINIKKGLFVSLVLGTAFLFSSSNKTLATGVNSPQECINPTATIQGDEDLLTFTAPQGAVVDGVCIKSGNNMFDNSNHSDILGNGTYGNGCYSVSGVGTDTVIIQRIGNPSSSCQALSHVDIIDSPAPSSSPTPSPSPTPTPASIAALSIALDEPQSSPDPSETTITSSVNTNNSNDTTNNLESSTETNTSNNSDFTSTENDPSNNQLQAARVLGLSTARELPETGIPAALFFLTPASFIIGISLILNNLRYGRTIS